MFGDNPQNDKNPLRRVFYFADNCLFANRHHIGYGRFKRPVNRCQKANDCLSDKFAAVQQIAAPAGAPVQKLV